jgi:hypothetical protein
MRIWFVYVNTNGNTRKNTPKPMPIIAQQKFVTVFSVPAQYFKQLGNNRYQPGIYLCPTALRACNIYPDQLCNMVFKCFAVCSLRKKQAKRTAKPARMPDSGSF